MLSASAASPLVEARANDIGPDVLSATESLIDNGGYAVIKNNKFIAAHNLHKAYVPASIIKIATALAALKILGPRYRFKTNFYLDDRQNLYIKGFGDPFLISEEVAAIVAKLKRLGCKEINDIYLDNAAFQLTAAADGAGSSDNPYDAQNSALAVNFNTINIEIEKRGRVVSAEEQTPFLPLMVRMAAGLDPGTHRVNITRGKNDGDTIISQYAGELFRAFLQQEKISVLGTIARRTTPDNLPLLYVHRSTKTLKDCIGPLMLYSNNFIANQLFLALGSHKYGYPATWEKSILAMASYLQKEKELSAKEIRIIEGSGLSRKNRVSPQAMIRLLESFKPYAKLLPQEDGKFMKSGTLKGVYSYAGYFVKNGKLDSFALLLNQGNNTRDSVLDVLEHLYHTD